MLTIRYVVKAIRYDKSVCISAIRYALKRETIRKVDLFYMLHSLCSVQCSVATGESANNIRFYTPSTSDFLRHSFVTN